MDDNKLSHADAFVVTYMIQKIESKFGELTVTHGHKNDFFGMDIIFNENGTVTISISCYIAQAIKMFGDTFHYGVATLAT